MRKPNPTAIRRMTMHATAAEYTTVQRAARAAGFTGVPSYLRHLAGLPRLKVGRPAKQPRRVE